MKSIFVIGSCFPAELGGPSNTIHRFSKALTKSGSNVEIWSTLHGITKKHKNEYNIIENQQVDIKGVNVTFFSFFLTHLFPVRMFLKFLFLNRDTNVHLSSIFYFPNLLIMSILSIKRCAFTIAPRGELFEPALAHRKTFKKLYLYILSTFLSKATHIIATSSEEADTIRKKFPSCNELIRIIPNYLELESQHSVEVGSNILYMGRLHPHKCIDRLIIAYQSLPLSLRENYSLQIAGDGDVAYKTYLNSLVQKDSFNISFLGHLTDDKKRAALSECCILVLPSKSENFGNVILEALSAARPVIACHNSPWSSVINNRCGYYISNSSEELALALKEYVTLSRDEKRNMAQRARLLAKSEYCIDSNVDKLVATFM